MNPKENLHYVNKHGQQLKHFMIKKFGLEEYKIWCKLNAFKYQARAGKKEDNSLEKDKRKRDDYVSEVFGTEQMQHLLISDLVLWTEEFEEWEGE